MACNCKKCRVKSKIKEFIDPFRPSIGMVSLREGSELDNYYDYKNGDITLGQLRQRLEDS